MEQPATPPPRLHAGYFSAEEENDISFANVLNCVENRKLRVDNLTVTDPQIENSNHE